MSGPVSLPSPSTFARTHVPLHGPASTRGTPDAWRPRLSPLTRQARQRQLPGLGSDPPANKEQGPLGGAVGSGEHPAVLGSRDMGRKQTTKATPRGPRSQPRASTAKAGTPRNKTSHVASVQSIHELTLTQISGCVNKGKEQGVPLRIPRPVCGPWAPGGWSLTPTPTMGCAVTSEEDGVERGTLSGQPRTRQTRPGWWSRPLPTVTVVGTAGPCMSWMTPV